MATIDEIRDIADHWLSAELDRIWLLAERALRAFQRAQVRPPPGHPIVAEVEAVFAARRAARVGADALPPADVLDDELELSAAIDAAHATVGGLRKQTLLGRLAVSLQLRPLEVETLVVTMAPHLDASLADVFNILKGPAGTRRGVDLALVSSLFWLGRPERVALLDALDVERPLLRWRLLEIQPLESVEGFSSMSHRGLRPTFDLVSVLCGAADSRRSSCALPA